AIGEQAATLLHTSNLFHHPLQAELASRLAELSTLRRAFSCTSAAEAVEACLKFARRFWHAQGTPRATFVAFEHSFHGRTMGAVSVTWDHHYRDQFAPLVPGVTFVNPEDAAAIAAAVTPDTAAVIVEPLQGEGGVRPISRRAADAIALAGGACGSPDRPTGGRCHRGGVSADRRAAHRRRSAVRFGAHRAAVLLGRARPYAGPDGDRQGARRRRPHRRGALLGEGRRGREAGRSR